MEKIPDEVRKQIEEGVKEIAKKSTAPDKETPDWMETDIRRGAEFGYFLASKASHPEQGEQGELYKWVKATSDNLPKFNDVIPRQVFAIRYKNVSGSYNYGWLTANQISDYRKSSLYNDLEWLCKLSSPPPEGQDWEELYKSACESYHEAEKENDELEKQRDHYKALYEKAKQYIPQTGCDDVAKYYKDDE